MIEIESYPQADTSKQIRDDAAMVLLSRGVLPDILLVVLRPKGNQTVDAEQIIASAHGWSELRLRIRVVRMWTIPADQLLAANDVGLIPWLPLADYSGSPDALLQQCKDRIDRQARPEEKENLLATTQVMAEMRYNDPGLFSLLGGTPMSMQKIFEASPSIKEFTAKKNRELSYKYILQLLNGRFGPIAEDLAAHLRTVENQDRLDDLHALAMECGDLDGFRAAMRGLS